MKLFQDLKPELNIKLSKYFTRTTLHSTFFCNFYTFFLNVCQHIKNNSQFKLNNTKYLQQFTLGLSFYYFVFRAAIFGPYRLEGVSGWHTNMTF